MGGRIYRSRVARNSCFYARCSRSFVEHERLAEALLMPGWLYSLLLSSCAAGSQHLSWCSDMWHLHLQQGTLSFRELGQQFAKPNAVRFFVRGTERVGSTKESTCFLALRAQTRLICLGSQALLGPWRPRPSPIRLVCVERRRRTMFDPFQKRLKQEVDLRIVSWSRKHFMVAEKRFFGFCFFGFLIWNRPIHTYISKSGWFLEQSSV